ncbi:hypothetical protein AX15_002233 [Amanita polypyramis BW_CC]|nr:hypothetical protein AX15_002233 [Amanita polypyramis BW_CC]
MLTLNLLALSLAMVPSLAYAALFSSNSMVKMLDQKGFKKAMKANQTSVIAFVAPWCGHCQRMVPEYSKAAQSLHPLIPAYAVDCDNDANKRLCSEQRVQGFPTLKVFPRGNQVPPMTYESGDRTASAIFKWASLRVPNHVDKATKMEEIKSWAEKNGNKHRAMLLTKEKKVPLLWKVLGNKYKGQLQLAIVKDEKGKIPGQLGLKSKETKVVVYLAGSTTPVVYEGTTKLDSLSKLFDSLLDGTADILSVDDTREKSTDKEPPYGEGDQVVLEAENSEGRDERATDEL